MSQVFSLHLELALLAGEALVKAGAETYRVEDTMNRILSHAQAQSYEAFAYSTGLFASITAPHQKPETIIRRIHHRSINLNTIAEVNAISRALCDNTLDTTEAFTKIKLLSKSPYDNKQKLLGLLLLVLGFALLLGGNINDALLSTFNAFILHLFFKLADRLNANDFIKTMLGAAVITIGAQVLNLIPLETHSDLIAIASIMPLVPGTAITNAIRDTLYGDYMSGAARALEAFVIAASVAIGVGLGLSLIGAFL